MPLLLFTDIGDFFQSLNHSWLFIVLRASNFRLGVINLISSIFLFIFTVAPVCANNAMLFEVLSAVVQDCPLAILCCLKFFDSKIVRVCADDVGCTLGSLDALWPLAAIIKLARSLVRLEIKFKKSFVIPAVEPPLLVPF